MTSDFATGKSGGFDNDGCLALTDDFRNVRSRKRAGALNIPQITAVCLRPGGGNVEDQFARITQIRVRIDGLAGGSAREVVEREIQSGLGSVGADAQRG